MAIYPRFASESQPQNFELKLSGKRRLFSTESAKLIRWVLEAQHEEGLLENWHKDKWNKKLRTLVTSAEPWIQLYLKPDIALDFLVKEQWPSTHPNQSNN